MRLVILAVVLGRSGAARRAERLTRGREGTEAGGRGLIIVTCGRPAFYAAGAAGVRTGRRGSISATDANSAPYTRFK